MSWIVSRNWECRTRQTTGPAACDAGPARPAATDTKLVPALYFFLQPCLRAEWPVKEATQAAVIIWPADCARTKFLLNLVDAVQSYCSVVKNLVFYKLKRKEMLWISSIKFDGSVLTMLQISADCGVRPALQCSRHDSRTRPDHKKSEWPGGRHCQPGLVCNDGTF